ncbi:SusC/RagA family TonB-linked outer membrane protein [Niabella hibiscisoli]|nr:SusC/RagA family TonB-linked outer membrane protein [Niabella hibiscisoli]
MYLPDFTDATNYALLYNEVETNAGRAPRFSNGILDTIRNQLNPDYYPDNNWYDLTLRKNAPIMEHQLNVSGGDRVKYYLSGAYFLQNSLIPGKDLRRYSVRANTEAKLSEKFKASSNISFIRDGFNNDQGNIDFTGLSRLTPLNVARHSDGTWGSINAGAVDAALASGNTLRRLAEGGRSSYNTNRFIGTLNGTYTPIKGLDISGLFSYNFMNYVTSTFANTMTPIVNFINKQPLTSTAVTVNQLDEQWQNTSNILGQLTAAYSYQLNAHNFNILGGTSYENFKDRFIRVIRKNFVNNDLDAINAGSANPLNTTATGNIQQRAFRSYFGRLNYAYNNRYLFEASLRNDASSQFAPGNRVGWYPSASFAWRISQENFMKNVSIVNELKLRLSAGKLGNVNNVGYYDFYDGLGTGTVVILDQTKQDGVFPAKLPNPLLTWEKVDMYNVGIDATLFKGLNLQVDLFNKLTKDILLSNPDIPAEGGLTDTQNPSINIGQVRNTGFEFIANYNGKINSLTYTIGGNISQIWNKVVDLGKVEQTAPSGYYVNRVGEAIGSFFMYESNGFYESDAEAQKYNPAAKAGDIRYVDQNNDGVINGDDRIIAGNDVPYFIYGLNLNVSYKNFDFTAIGSGVKNVKVYLEAEASQAFFNGAGVKIMCSTGGRSTIQVRPPPTPACQGLEQ